MNVSGCGGGTLGSVEVEKHTIGSTAVGVERHGRGLPGHSGRQSVSFGLVAWVSEIELEMLSCNGGAEQFDLGNFLWYISKL